MNPATEGFDFLPGRMVLERGTARDYRALASFHYASGPPATWAAVWVVRFFPNDPVLPARLAGVGVLSWPVPSCRARERALQLGGSRCEKIQFVNAHLRTISRVIVHPQFRSIGLSTLLVRCLCDNCETRYVEAMAMMGHAHPLFERAGMKRVDPQQDNDPVYYFLDRAAAASAA